MCVCVCVHRVSTHGMYAVLSSFKHQDALFARSQLLITFWPETFKQKFWIRIDHAWLSWFLGVFFHSFRLRACRWRHEIDRWFESGPCSLMMLFMRVRVDVYVVYMAVWLYVYLVYMAVCCVCVCCIYGCVLCMWMLYMSWVLKQDMWKMPCVLCVYGCIYVVNVHVSNLVCMSLARKSFKPSSAHSRCICALACVYVIYVHMFVYALIYMSLCVRGSMQACFPCVHTEGNSTRQSRKRDRHRQAGR